MATANLKKRTPHKALKMETSFKMLHGREADLLHLRVVGAKPFVHIKNSRNINFAVGRERVRL